MDATKGEYEPSPQQGSEAADAFGFAIREIHTMAVGADRSGECAANVFGSLKAALGVAEGSLEERG